MQWFNMDWKHHGFVVDNTFSAMLRKKLKWALVPVTGFPSGFFQGQLNGCLPENMYILHDFDSRRTSFLLRTLYPSTYPLFTRDLKNIRKYNTNTDCSNPRFCFSQSRSLLIQTTHLTFLIKHIALKASSIANIVFDTLIFVLTIQRSWKLRSCASPSSFRAGHGQERLGMVELFLRDGEEFPICLSRG